MAHGEFLLLGGLAECATQLRTVEQRVITEASLAARFVDDGPFHRAAPHTAQFAGLRQRDGAHETSRAIFHAAELLDQQAIIRLVHRQRRTFHRRMQQRESRREDSRRALDRVHFEAGIVREKQSRGVPAVVQRLDRGIVFERAAVFHAGLDLFEPGQQLNFHRRQSGSHAEFPQLSGVPGGALQANQIGATFF